MIYTVTFNPALDYMVHVDKLTLGGVNRTTAERVYYGGKGINVSTVLRQLDVGTMALGFVAGFTGMALENGVNALGIPSDFIHLKTGMSRINVKIKSECETEINGQGPEIDQSAIEELFRKLDAIQSGDILVLAGSIPNTLPEDMYEKIMKRLKEKTIKVVVDATKELLLNVLEYQPFLIKPNNHELGEMFGTELKSDNEILDHAQKLQQKGARNVLISMAGDGAILLTEDGEHFKIGTPKGTVKNSVGAGDSMVAGFLAGYLKTGSYEYALKLGTAAGSATAFSNGLAERNDIETLFNQIS